MENEKKLSFFKERIKEKLEQIREDIPEIRYKLWIASVDACDDYNELREMAELDMQLDLFEYTRNEINPKLEQLNMNITELREGKTIVVKDPENKYTNAQNIEPNTEIMGIGPVINYTTEEIINDLDDT